MGKANGNGNGNGNSNSNGRTVKANVTCCSAFAPPKANFCCSGASLTVQGGQERPTAKLPARTQGMFSLSHTPLLPVLSLSLPPPPKTVFNIKTKFHSWRMLEFSFLPTKVQSLVPVHPTRHIPWCWCGLFQFDVPKTSSITRRALRRPMDKTNGLWR